MVTHGLAVRVISSGVRSGSTSTGLVVAMGTSWHRRRGGPRLRRTLTLGPVRSSTALLTDHYELTMLQAALGSGTAQRRSVFELFPRRLPEGRRYGVVAGVGRALDALEAFRFDDETLRTVRDVVDDRTCEWLASYRFT